MKPDTPRHAAPADAAIRRAIRLRYRLLPYLYSLMHGASERGEPVIRPTFLHFEDDPGCAADCDELMLGPFLLAARADRAGEAVATVLRQLRIAAWAACAPSAAELGPEHLA